MKKLIVYNLVALVLLFGSYHQADAALQAFSPNNFITAGGLDTGYPVWYQDFNDLKLELCALNNGLCLLAPPLDPILGVGPETFWWTSETSLTFTGGTGLLVLAMEGAFLNENPVPGEQVTFGRIRIRIDGLNPSQVYTVTHPFGSQDFTTDAVGGINFTDDAGCLAALPCDFNLALNSNVGPFLFWDADLPVLDPGGVAGDNFYIGDGATPHRVLGSPNGNNVFRIEQDGVLIAETDLFVVTGKVFTGDGNTAPNAVADNAAVAANETTTVVANTVNIPVLANDTRVDIPINPASMTIGTQPAGGTVARTVGADGQLSLTYTPNPGFTGTDTLTYTVANFAGTASAPATVNIIVEDLQALRAVFRPKLMKWQIVGTSSNIANNTISVRMSVNEQSTNLSGANVVPPVTTTSAGTATVTVNDAQTQMTFTVTTANILNVTGASIHLGSAGTNGPAIFNLATGDFASPLTGTLTPTSLIAQPAQGINTFADAVQAVLSGNTYVVVTTAANPNGQIRGQLGSSRFIGQAPVQADGSWTVQGSDNLLMPSAARTVIVESANGIRIPNVPVEIR